MTITTKSLESDISTLEELHQLRDQAYEFRRIGLEQLAKSLDADPSDRWKDTGEEPNDLVYPAILKTLAFRGFARDLPAAKKIDSFASSAFSKMLDLSPLISTTTASGEPSSDVQLFQAARIMRAGLTSPTSEPLPGFFLSFYALLREINNVQPPSWMMGSVRAREGSVPTAFVTGETCRAFNAFARSLEATARQATALLNLARRVSELTGETDACDAWKEVELRRQVLSSYCSIAIESNRSLVIVDIRSLQELVTSTRLDATRVDFRSAVNSLVKHYVDEVRAFCANARESIERELKTANVMFRAEHPTFDFKAQIDAEHQENRSGADSRSRGEFEQQDYLNHVYAYRRILEFQGILEVGKSVANELLAWTETPSESIRLDNAEKLIGELRDAGDFIRKLMEPSRKYIESVLDQELTNSKIGKFNAPELIFAASAMSSIDRRRNDEQYEEAISRVLDWVQNDGLNDSSSYLDTDNRGYSLVLLGSEVARALAQLISRIDVDLPTSLFRSILDYFHRTAVLHTEGGELIGWRHDRPRYPIKAHRWTSALAIIAIDRLARTLDKRINHRVQRHFTTKKIVDLDVPNLNDLAYPDYGLARLAPKALFSKNADMQNQSVSFFLERARAHLNGVKDFPGYSTPCYSMLLFGPPGTGKTTLVESLAKTSNVDLVEVTPSDILIEGEAWLEKRAKIVFRALSFLTSTVVMFDEFDPVLRSRHLDSSRNAYSFLTPGMLPKLKYLNSEARKRRLVFVLITNRIGTLDDAAIRSGRFDFKIGIYPPDLLSRAGKIVEAVKHVKATDSSPQRKQVHEESLLNCIVDTAGLGMTFLSRKGNFSKLNAQDVEKLDENALMRCIFDEELDFDPGPKDAKFCPSTAPANDLEAFENEQWSWIIDQDQKAMDIRESCRKSTVKRSDMSIKELMDLLDPVQSRSKG